jgi:hypothetical protein
MSAVMHGENPPNHILINRCSEAQIDLLGDLRTSLARIAPLHLDDGLDQVRSGPLGAWLVAPFTIPPLA